MPAYNEGAHIFKNIATTRRVLNEAGVDAEIIVVDDGSTDNTREEIERAARSIEGVRAVGNPYNMGKGMALRTGFDHSSGDLVVFLDADLDLHPSQILTLVEHLERVPCDIVVTSKHHPDSKLAYPFKRKVASYMYYLIIRALFGLPVRDTQTGLKIFRRAVLENVFHRLLVKAYAYDVELLATAVRFGYRVHEVPVVLDFKRGLDWGRIQVGDVIRIFIDTLAVFYRLRIIRYYDDERPPWPHDGANVLVVLRGSLTDDRIIRRLRMDSRTVVASQGEVSVGDCGPGKDVLRFSGEDDIERFLDRDDVDFPIIGFLGEGCIPVGSWVKNALRNFGDDTVGAVCGPVVPGPYTTFTEKVAGMLYSSPLTSGPYNYLHAVKRIRFTGRGRRDNVFMRTEAYRSHAFIQSGEVFIIPAGASVPALKYDPDVAVARRVPPLFGPYLRQVAYEAFGTGGDFSARPVVWAAIPACVWLVIFFGWMVMPEGVYGGFLAVYGAGIVLSGLMYADPIALPLFTAGMILDNAVRALAFTAGLCMAPFRKINRKE